jgi:hypothetical protein
MVCDPEFESKNRIFKAGIGLTPKALAVAHRSDRMREELPKWNTVTEAIYGAGFNSKLFGNCRADWGAKSGTRCRACVRFESRRGGDSVP